MKTEISVSEVKEMIKSNKELSQSGLARKCGVSKSLVSKWLNEKQDIPENHIETIFEYIGVELIASTVDEEQEEVNRKEKYNLIREDLTEQLVRQGKFGKHYEDLVDHAVYFFELKDELQDDIKINGIRISMETGNGYNKQSDNASIRNLNQVSSQLMRVLKDLGLNDPDVLDNDDFNEEDFT